MVYLFFFKELQPNARIYNSLGHYALVDSVYVLLRDGALEVFIASSTEILRLVQKWDLYSDKRFKTGTDTWDQARLNLSTDRGTAFKH